MNNAKYPYILYLIIVVIIATIGIQAYWNYKNYLSNKRQLITDVQTSLDKVVDDYYTKLAHETTLSLTFDGDSKKNALKDGGILDNIAESIDRNNSSFKGLDSLNLDSISNITVIRGIKADSLRKRQMPKKLLKWRNDSTRENHELRFIKRDSSDINKQIELLTSKVFISISHDSLDLKKIDSLLKFDLTEKKIDLDYTLNYEESKKRFPGFFSETKDDKEMELNPLKTKDVLSVTSKSTLLPKNATLTLHFNNANWATFKRGINAIIISFILVLAVVSCLFFLLKVIREQKQLAEVKNDLISNITHEFKTPIATIGVALEGIKNFNVIEDRTKTEKYVDISSEQLSKLNVMVEKLLETATLDSEALEFNKEPLDLVHLLNSLVSRNSTQHDNKTFTSNIHLDSLIINADPFHIENVINNILDNAVKYGGNTISIDLKTKKGQIELLISDNGNTLNTSNKERIFEKFYRMPKGNTHDIKGYGIGLYYTKAILEKHDGSIQVNLSNGLTTFKITLPNE